MKVFGKRLLLRRVRSSPAINAVSAAPTCTCNSNVDTKVNKNITSNKKLSESERRLSGRKLWLTKFSFKGLKHKTTQKSLDVSQEQSLQQQQQSQSQQSQQQTEFKTEQNKIQQTVLNSEQSLHQTNEVLEHRNEINISVNQNISLSSSSSTEISKEQNKTNTSTSQTKESQPQTAEPQTQPETQSHKKSESLLRKSSVESINPSRLSVKSSKPDLELERQQQQQRELEQLPEISFSSPPTQRDSVTLSSQNNQMDLNQSPEIQPELLKQLLLEDQQSLTLSQKKIKLQQQVRLKEEQLTIAFSSVSENIKSLQNSVRSIQTNSQPSSPRVEGDFIEPIKKRKSFKSPIPKIDIAPAAAIVREETKEGAKAINYHDEALEFYNAWKAAENQ